MNGDTIQNCMIMNSLAKVVDQWSPVTHLHIIQTAIKNCLVSCDSLLVNNASKSLKQD